MASNMNAFWLLSLVGLTGLTALGDSFLNSAGDQKTTNYAHLLLGLTIYLLTGVVWFFVYKHLKFSVSGAIYGVLTVIVFAAVGVLYFRESLRPTEIIGMLMAIGSIVLLSRFEA